MLQNFKTSTIIIFSVIWLGLLGFAYSLLVSYENTANKTEVNPKLWPRESQLKFDKRKDNLIIFLHPRCPCSDSSLEELNKLMAKSPKSINVIAVFMSSEKQDKETWLKGKLWKDIKANQEIKVFIDEKNTEIKRFKVNTSGEVLLYNSMGRLTYSGGISPARGHAGDNKGSQLIMKYLQGYKVQNAQSPVFGCLLQKNND